MADEAQKMRTLWRNDRIFRQAALGFGVSLVVFILSLGSSRGRVANRPVQTPTVQDQNSEQAEDSARSSQAGAPTPRKPRPKYGLPNEGH